jgi:branched-chain amino acid transport system substrate-binding protein
MEMKGNTLAIVLLVVGLVVGAGAGYFLAPSGDGGDGGDGDGGTVTVEVAPLAGKNIQLGYIVSNTNNLETTVPNVDDIMAVDYNEYLDKLGLDVTMEFLIDDATGQAAVHLEKVQGYKSMDINVFIGGGWSSQAQAALSYCNDNDMLMWSSSSTSPLLAIGDDNLYRMCPDDTIQAPAIAEMLVSHGIEAIILIQRGDAWADGIYNYLEPAYTEKGGTILEKIRYAGEATEFANYLQTAENIAEEAVAEYGEGKVAVEIISFAEHVVMITQAEDFPTIYSMKWFGSDGTALSAQAPTDAPEQALHLRIYSTYAAPAESSKFQGLYDRYYAMVSQPYGYYSACAYDIGWILMESIFNTQSLDANVLLPVQHDTAYNNFGASGWNLLNEAGDRAGSNYQIWSYTEEDGAVKHIVAGLYDTITDTVTWDTEAIGYTP